MGVSHMRLGLVLGWWVSETKDIECTRTGEATVQMLGWYVQGQRVWGGGHLGRGGAQREEGAA